MRNFKIQGCLGPLTPSDAYDYYVIFQPLFTPSKCCAQGGRCLPMPLATPPPIKAES